MSLIAKPLPPNQQARLDRAEAEKEILLYWLLQLFLADRREGWEEGMSDSEIVEGVGHVLHNFGMNPDSPKEKPLVDRLLKRKPIYGVHQDYIGWRIGR